MVSKKMIYIQKVLVGRRRNLFKRKRYVPHIFAYLWQHLYIFLWVPFFVAGYVCTDAMQNLVFFIYVGMINSVLDPLIYVSFNKKVKAVVVNQMHTSGLMLCLL